MPLAVEALAPAAHALTTAQAFQVCDSQRHSSARRPRPAHLSTTTNTNRYTVTLRASDARLTTSHSEVHRSHFLVPIRDATDLIKNFGEGPAAELLAGHEVDRVEYLLPLTFATRML